MLVLLIPLAYVTLLCFSEPSTTIIATLCFMSSFIKFDKPFDIKSNSFSNLKNFKTKNINFYKGLVSKYHHRKPCLFWNSQMNGFDANLSMEVVWHMYELLCIFLNCYVCGFDCYIAVLNCYVCGSEQMVFIEVCYLSSLLLSPASSRLVNTWKRVLVSS